MLSSPSSSAPTAATAPSPATAQKPGVAAPGRGRRVTDAPMRMFHALFALSFMGAYLTAESEHWRLLHVTLGYTFGGLLVFRVLYGLLGPRQVRLALLWRRLSSTPAWLRSFTSAAGPNARQGQNLLVAWALLALLVLVLPVVLSGYAVYNDLGGEIFEELHEGLANALLGVVLVHVSLVLGLSLLRRQNQALPMWSGRVPGPGPDLVPHNRGWLAALLLAAVAAFGVWQWRDAPSTGRTADGSEIAAGRGAVGPALERGRRHHDDD